MKFAKTNAGPMIVRHTRPSIWPRVYLVEKVEKVKDGWHKVPCGKVFVTPRGAERCEMGWYIGGEVAVSYYFDPERSTRGVFWGSMRKHGMWIAVVWRKRASGTRSRDRKVWNTSYTESALKSSCERFTVLP